MARNLRHAAKRLLTFVELPSSLAVALTALLMTAMVVAKNPLRCYECASNEYPDCGPMFRRSSFEPANCTDDAVCALLRQSLIKGQQIAGIHRTCYVPSQLEGLNSSNGCRYWTNEQEGFTALYCFCDTDLCNSAQTPATTLSFGVVSLTTVVCLLVRFCRHWVTRP